MQTNEGELKTKLF